ncbi:MAG: tRNA (adenosine(37)-N6)-dimethylallyltransferase MiaA [Candidatus Dojkabacteria bacterium]|nr:tRNA (adenosine(37)-N6)-dimethylallyltransferase MiaA [Candidatus Dojkabacteria bacterium]MDQ7021242.1 tRNA (adenosine(37)-N6)-dimethylallyltransferase MiaA [Candidatus Dojkabacteria bacterium]
MKNVLIVCGPTATGKTKYALKLAKELDGELISADSRQVYKDIPIATNVGNIKSKKLKVKSKNETSDKKLGTGKERGLNDTYKEVDKNEISTMSYNLQPNYLENIPIHLIQFLELDQSFDVYTWRKLALEKIEEVLNKGKQPIIVGGTGMYIDSLVKNYDLKSVEENIDWKERERLNELKVEELQDMLSNEYKFDLKELNNSDLNNPRRLIRLIEKKGVRGDEGQVVSGWNKKDYNFRIYYPQYKLDELDLKISRRVDEMIEEGLVSEVRNAYLKFKAKGYSLEQIKELPGFLVMGVKEIAELMNEQEEIATENIQESISRIKMEHRKYAKRQRTWFEGKTRGYVYEEF